tara:strand:+ start:1672 stop:2307 length:636 start_codon:yes stop_codon:yes gene_type:complete
MRKLLYLATGTTRGIGWELQKLFKTSNSDYILINRKDIDLSDTTGLITFLESLAERIKEEYSDHRIIFINNASTLGNPAPMENNSLSDVSQTLNVNVVAPILFFNFLTQLDNEWVLLNVTSGAAHTENQFLGLYSTSKLAVEKYIKFVDSEDNNCKGVYNFDPGVVETDMYKALKENKHFYNERLQKAEARQPFQAAYEIWKILERWRNND